MQNEIEQSLFNRAFPFAAQGLNAITGLAGSFLKKRPTSFSQTEHARRLKLLQSRGKYSPQARETITNRLSNVSGNQAQNTMAQYTGQLLNQGMGGSIAGMRGANEINMEHGQRISDVVRKIQLENEQSKQEAANEYARLATQRADQIRQFDNNRIDAITGQVQQGIGGMADIHNQRQAQEHEQEIERQLFDILYRKEKQKEIDPITEIQGAGFLNPFYRDK